MSATVVLADLPTGQTLTVDAYADGSDTLADGSPFTLTEATNRKTVYTYSNPTLTGLHRLLVKLGSVVIGSRWATLAATGVIEATSERIDAIDVDGDVTYSVVVPTAIAEAAAVENIITAIRGDTLTRSFLDIGDLTARTSLKITVKNHTSDIDNAAVLLITEAGGLIRLAGVAAPDPTQASITVIDEDDGEITFTVSATVMATLYANADLPFDVQYTNAAGVTTPVIGRFRVVADVNLSTGA